MTIISVLMAYTMLAATLALVLSLLILRSLTAGTAGPAMGGAAGPRVVTLPASGPEIATPAPAFTARTSTAALFDTAELAGRSHLLAFLSSSCQGCRAALPALVEHASRLSASQRLIAVIVGDARRGADIGGLLEPVATVVFEAAGGPISSAYGITLFPSYVLVSETGTVLATGQSMLDLPQPQPQ